MQGHLTVLNLISHLRNQLWVTCLRVAEVCVCVCVCTGTWVGGGEREIWIWMLPQMSWVKGKTEWLLIFSSWHSYIVVSLKTCRWGEGQSYSCSEWLAAEKMREQKIRAARAKRWSWRQGVQWSTEPGGHDWSLVSLGTLHMDREPLCIRVSLLAFHWNSHSLQSWPLEGGENEKADKGQSWSTLGS